MKFIWLFDRKYIVMSSDMTYLTQIKLKCRISLQTTYIRDNTLCILMIISDIVGFYWF